MRPYILGSLLAVTLITSCLSGPQEKPVSKEEALALSKNIDEAIAKEDPGQFLSMIQTDVLIQRIGKAGNTKVTGGLRRGLTEGLKNANLGGQIINAIGGGKGTYELVKQYEKNKVQHLVYRMFGEGGLNYHDFELTKVDGKVYVADIFIYLTGENFSVSMADIMEGLDQSSDKDGEKTRAANNFKRIRVLLMEKKHEEAKRLFEQLPASLKQRKMAQVNYLLICSGLSTEEYSEALEKFERKYRNEPNMYISLIDAYFLQKEYGKTLNAINSLDSLIDRDNFLNYYRGMIYYNWGKPAESRDALENLYEHYPNFQAGVIELVHNYLIAKDHEKARAVVETYRKNERFDQEVLNTNLAVYPDFTE